MERESNVVVHFEKVSKFYGKIAAVNELTLDVYNGELVVLIGPSGCGKTTTLKMVNRLIEPTCGTIYLEGTDIAAIDPVQLRRDIGYVIQQIGLFPHMTIEENISVVPRLHNWPEDKKRARAKELLELVGMDPDLYMHRYPSELSGGQQQRIGVLRALAVEPDLILMDEPFGALDPITREQLQEEMKNLQDQLHNTIIFVTHDMDEALKLADRVVLMSEGSVVQVGTPDEMLRFPANSFVREFIGKDRLIRSPEEVLVDEVMQKRPVTIRPRQGLAEALERMRSHKVDSLILADEKGNYRGVVSGRVLRQNIDKGVGRVEEIASFQSALSSGTSMREAVQVMADNNLAFLPVVDEDGKLKGLITRSSLVDILVDHIWLEEKE